jgi:hypothetical protein
VRELKVPRHEQYKGSIYTYSVDLTLIEQELSLTASTVTWSTQDSSIVSIGTSALTSSVASAPLTASSEGSALIKLVITTSGDDKIVYFFEVKVIDLEAS